MCFNQKFAIDYAEYLLVFTAEPLENIAFACGWADLESFTEMFEKEIGVTPYHYRDWHLDCCQKTD